MDRGAGPSSKKRRIATVSDVTSILKQPKSPHPPHCVPMSFYVDNLVAANQSTGRGQGRPLFQDNDEIEELAYCILLWTATHDQSDIEQLEKKNKQTYAEKDFKDGKQAHNWAYMIKQSPFFVFRKARHSSFTNSIAKALANCISASEDDACTPLEMFKGWLCALLEKCFQAKGDIVNYPLVLNGVDHFYGKFRLTMKMERDLLLAVDFSDEMWKKMEISYSVFPNLYNLHLSSNAAAGGVTSGPSKEQLKIIKEMEQEQRDLDDYYKLRTETRTQERDLAAKEARYLEEFKDLKTKMTAVRTKLKDVVAERKCKLRTLEIYKDDFERAATGIRVKVKLKYLRAVSNGNENQLLQFAGAGNIHLNTADVDENPLPPTQRGIPNQADVDENPLPSTQREVLIENTKPLLAITNKQPEPDPHDLLDYGYDEEELTPN